MLMPSRTKFRKVRKGRIHGGTATAMNQIAYGKYGLVSLGSEHISAQADRSCPPSHDQVC